MLQRKAYDDLIQWKNSDNKKCMMVKGARQVGKTYLIRYFGAKEYSSFIEINFIKQPELKRIFEGELSFDEIIKRITANIHNIEIVPGNTLLFLDEIQTCANARTALKFLSEESKIDVIASGSLLGLSYGQDGDKDVERVDSIPVGYETPLMMYPLDFEEYLWANGFNGDAIRVLKGYYEKIDKVPESVHTKYEGLVREYIVVGGMPEVVEDFITHKDFNRVHAIQERLVSDYEDDIAQHAKGVEKPKVRRCYDAIPNQLARENKKYKYSEVEKKATSKKYGDSIQWLVDANMTLRCNNLLTPMLPLKYNEKENEFKLYLYDTGLLMSIFGKETKWAFLNNTLIGSAKGGIYENFIAGELVKKGYSIHYYKPSDTLELEFILEKDSGVVPIEVKAGNTATVSLNKYIEQYKPSIAYKFIAGNVGLQDVKLSLPHYMILFM